ncbi:hypothetical protein FY145_07135 [Agrobacterium tumefaciens]|uniref:Uncharacterized protein n=1 Tax=Agrobacterium tumefaciens TaxID=358 RepID=A0AAP9E398_AGRTU|nr:hypothetical protein [Agrobacterium tumefaciens]NSZ57803.1 hypothetical protein [Agrobacterium tumefaciens]QDY93921.1 hypothetical protein CG010_007130 [Agrobacterium tumefaciens]UXS48994.1 hypothetical protein FY149_17255 [Agrobacterium tumefaciens]UXS70298.1 hypothetical protein FY146_07135 [Agrobacterium tumefaciens]UXS77960.1 hypothetical protein FY145_07135 [Agrobacterium tumefaciens]
MTAAVGHNIEKAERERRVLFAFYHKKDRDIAAQIKALQSEKSSNRQNAKASGFPAQKLDHYLKSFNAEDHQKPVDKLKSERENLEWLGYIPATSGGDLLTQIDRVDGEQMIQAKGFHAGLTGLDRVSGYDGGSVDDKLWLESYDAGKREYDSEIPDIMARITAAQSKEEAPANGDDPFELDQTN